MKLRQSNGRGGEGCQRIRGGGNGGKGWGEGELRNADQSREGQDPWLNPLACRAPPLTTAFSPTLYNQGTVDKKAKQLEDLEMSLAETEQMEEREKTLAKMVDQVQGKIKLSPPLICILRV
eukprot:2500691-Pyramimonas_sp.AAC.2